MAENPKLATEQPKVSFSSELERTLHRSLALANEKEARHATIEHLLLALVDDSDAATALKACAVDLQSLRAKVTDFLDQQNVEKFSQGKDSEPTVQFRRVIQRAVIHVQSSGRIEVNGAFVLIAIFAERESQAAFMLQEFDVTRYDLVNFISHGIAKRPETKRPETKSTLSNDLVRIERSISKSAQSAPNFQVRRNRIYYREAPAKQAIRERKQLAVERCAELQKICSVRANEQPDLVAVVARYAAALRALKKNGGTYKLLVVGLEIETLLRIKERAPTDPDRNPPLGADLLFATQSLIIAHAGLISLYPDAQNSFIELDQYRQQSEAIDALRDRILDPVLNHLANSTGVLDDRTREQTEEIVSLNDLDQLSTLPSRGVASTKHAWLRGALTSIGQYVLTQTKKIATVARDTAVKETVSAAARSSDRLLAAIMSFFEGARIQLLSLADALINSFGWIRSLLNLLGL